MNIELSLSLALAALAAVLLRVGRTEHRVRAVLMALSVALGARYLVWRALWTLNAERPWILAASVTLLIAECYGFTSMLFFFFQTVSPVERRPTATRRRPPPTVDVFVTTFNEPVDVVERSLVCCKALVYPPARLAVYLLDDGSRPEMRRLADSLDCRYLARGEHSGAKAGNVNFGLAHSRGELILMLDCDHAPVRSFLEETVGFFDDPNVAILQTPHHFFNPDIFQRSLRLEKQLVNDQDLFFYVIEPGRDGRNASFFAGSCGILRRSALDQIGGFPTTTVTEDLHASMLIHSRGWKSVYLKKTLSAGLAPESFSGLLHQRRRWARGSIQVLYQANPLFLRGLSPAQRLEYSASIFYFFNGWARIVYLLSPLTWLFFHRAILVSNAADFMSRFVPYYIAFVSAFSAISLRFRNPFWSDVYETATCFALSAEALKTIVNPGDRRFHVTAKGAQGRLDESALPDMLPHAATALLLLAGLAADPPLAVTRANIVTQTLTYFWALYNLSVLCVVLAVARRLAHRRASTRAARRVRCILHAPDGPIDGWTSDLSESGLSMQLHDSASLPDRIALTLAAEYGEKTELDALVVRHDGRPGNQSVGLRFVDVDDAARHSLIRQIFSAAHGWDRIHRPPPGTMSSLGDMLLAWRRVFLKDAPRRRRRPRKTSTAPCRLRADGTGVAAVLTDIDAAGARLKAYGPVRSDAVVIDIEAGGKPFSAPAKVVRRERGRDGEPLLVAVRFETPQLELYRRL